MLSIILIALYVVFAVGGSTLIKYGGISKATALFTLPVVNVHMSLVSFLGIVFYGLSFLLYILLLNKFDLSFISPVTVGLVYVLLMVTAAIIFKEDFTIVKTIGCALILAGILLIVTTSKSIS